MIRTLLAVLAGYLVFGISAGLLFGVSGRNPKQWHGILFAALSTLYGMCFAFLGGWLAAKLAVRNPARHSLMVAVTIVTIAVVSAVLQAREASLWTEVCTVLFMAPAAAIAGRFRR